MIQYRKTWQNTARIARIIDNMVICRTFVRSVFFITTTRGDGFIDRSPQIATADLMYGVGALAGLSYTSMVARSLRSVSYELPRQRRTSP